MCIRDSLGVVEDFSGSGRVVAVFAEVLPKGEGIRNGFAPVLIVGIHPASGWMKPSHSGCAGGITARRGAVVVGESDSL